MTVNWAVRPSTRPAVEMPCPFCRAEARLGKIVDTHPLSRGGGTLRRRACPSCGERFTTVEKITRQARPKAPKSEARS